MEKKSEQQPEKVRIEGTKRIEHKNIYAALSAFQGELKPMDKTGKVEYSTKSGNGKVEFKYTPLGEIMKTIYPLLARHGLAVRHEVRQGDDKQHYIEAILTHETYIEGQEVATETYTPVNDVAHTVDLRERKFITKTHGELRSGPIKISWGTDMKDTGAAMTYARRYSITMLLGISSEDDLDAELLEQSAKNAIQTVFDRFAAGVAKSKTIDDIDKAMDVVKKDIAKLAEGKAPALGLTKEHYDELIKLGEARKAEISE